MKAKKMLIKEIMRSLKMSYSNSEMYASMIINSVKEEMKNDRLR